METYIGHVRSPADAIKLFEACRLGLLPRVQRRLSEKERQSIKSGSVFVWDEREAGMRRWTDGKSWSASRVSGSFLTYREMEGKRGGGSFAPPPVRRISGKTPDSGRGSDEDMEMDGDGPDGYRYKPDGLMKQSFSITTSNGQHLHLISYYSRPNSNGVELLQPTQDQALRHIVPVKGMYPESTVHEQAQGPAITRAPMQSAYMASHSQIPPGPPGGQRAPYAYQIPPGYSWPPSPVATPPYTYGPNMYASQLAPPPGSTHGSPHVHPYSPHQTMPPPPQQQVAYDRPPPPLQNSSLPQGASAYHPSVTGPHPQAGGPVFAPTSSPHAEQARLVAEHQAQQAQRQLQAQAPLMIDPRITATAAAAIQQANGMSQSQESPRTSAPQTPKQELTPPQTQSQPQSQSQSASQSIPSISSLVHAADPAANKDPRSNGSTSRAASASPKTEGKPQDIPHDKMRFGGEDMRALRVLDRKFCI
ncbi:MAG: hypothetical protein M1818_000561 [Claussenomyces sp. TS43310]|nr:MAG: hypothetical protein M1818_000561 [Claussenomyces sp. TS43310]